MIILDERTGSAELLPYFPKDTVKLGRLEYGDASFLGKGPDNLPFLIGAERKTLKDLAKSMETGRLQGHQLPGLLASYNVVYLIVEGICRTGDDDRIEECSFNQWRSLGITDKALDFFINSLGVLAHVEIRQTTAPRRTAKLIHHIYQWWQKGWEEHKGHLGFALNLPPTLQLKKPSLLRRIAKELPGIGWERSKAVESYFGSIERMVMAKEEDWKEVKGIGNSLSKQLVNIMKEIKYG